jgi:ABC-2 type transport system permease protein
MRTFFILLRKELKGFFLHPFGWMVLAFVLVMHGVSISMAMKGFRDTASRESLVCVTFHTPIFWFYFLFVFPLLTMRLFSEEQRSGTIETLFTAPVRTGQVVLAKFSAAYLFYIFLWIPSFLQFKMFDWITGLPPAYSQGSMIGAYAILALMGALFLSFGCLASAMTSSQIIAGIVTIAMLIIQYFLGYVTVIWGTSFRGSAFFDHISAQQHLYYFAQGLIDTRTIVYYLSAAAFVLFLTYQVVDFRRWRR